MVRQDSLDLVKPLPINLSVERQGQGCEGYMDTGWHNSGHRSLAI